jgi:hypothetical protein
LKLDHQLNQLVLAQALQISPFHEHMDSEIALRGKGVGKYKPDYVTRIDDSRGYAQAITEIVWPFMRSEPRVRTLVKSDVAACGMVRGHVLYMSSLGTNSPIQLEQEDDKKSPPVRYIICSHKVRFDDGDISILVAQLHNAITLRHAALEMFGKIRNARGTCREINKEMCAIWELTEQDMTVVSREIKSRMLGVRVMINKLDDGFVNGIIDRVMRSKRYVEQFERVKNELAIESLRKFERYDRFLERLIGGKFRSIEKVGKIIEQIEGEYAALMRAYVAFLSARSLEAIVQRSTEMAELQDASRSLLRTIKELQSKAELLVCMFLVPYYFGNTCAEGLGGLFRVKEHSELEEQISQVSWTFAFVLAAGLTVHSCAENYDDSWPGRLSKKMLASVLKPLQDSSVGLVVAGVLFAAAWVWAVVVWDLPSKIPQ